MDGESDALEKKARALNRVQAYWQLILRALVFNAVYD